MSFCALCLSSLIFLFSSHVVSCWNFLTYFQFSYCILQLLGLPVWTFIFHIFVEILNVFMHSFLSLVSILWPLLWTLHQVNYYLCFIKVSFFWGVACSLFQTIITLVLHFTWLSLFLCIRWNSHLFRFEGLARCGGEPYCSTSPLFLVVSQLCDYPSCQFYFL